MVSQLDEIDLSKLYELMKPIYLPKIREGGENSRCGFPTYRGAVFGMVRPRKQSNIITLSANSKRYPAVYDALVKVGTDLDFSFNSIQVNRNLKCPPHKDKKNVGDSMLISFGEYTGGEIVVDGTEYNAYHKPTIFNGSQLEHYNKDIVGDKFSIIFFTMV